MMPEYPPVHGELATDLRTAVRWRSGCADSCFDWLAVIRRRAERCYGVSISGGVMAMMPESLERAQRIAETVVRE